MRFRRLVPDSVNRAFFTLDGVAGKSINVAKVLKALAQKPVAAGFIGGDRGREIQAVLAARNIESALLEVSTPTRQCITVVDESTGAVTELVEESKPFSPGDYQQLENLIRERISACCVAVMSGTFPPGGPVAFYAGCVSIAHQAGALSIVDTQGPPLMEAIKAGPGLVKPNRAELAATVGHDLRGEEAVIAAMRELCGRGAQRVVVTAGKEPALACDGRNLWRIHSPAIVAVNPIGSGDAFTAGLAWKLATGENLGEACRWAAAAGAANALSHMAGEVSLEDVERLAPQVTIEPLASP